MHEPTALRRRALLLLESADSLIRLATTVDQAELDDLVDEFVAYATQALLR